MPHEVINLENPSASNNHTSINAKEKEYAETTIIKLPKRLYTKKKRRMRGKTPTRTSTVRIDKDYHIYPPSDSKEIRSNSKLRVSHYLQASSPSIQPNIAKSEPILDIDDDESAKKKEIRRYLDSLNITPALDSKQLSPNLSNIKQYKVEDAAYLPKINDTDPDISDIRLEIMKKHVAKLL